MKQHKKWYKLKDERYLNTIKPLVDEIMMFESNMQYIPVIINKRGVNYDITFTLEIDKKTAQSFHGKTTLNEIITKFIEINTLSQV